MILGFMIIGFMLIKTEPDGLKHFIQVDHEFGALMLPMTENLVDMLLDYKPRNIWIWKNKEDAQKYADSLSAAFGKFVPTPIGL